MQADSSQDEHQWIVRLRNREADAWDRFLREFRDLVRGVIRQTAARRHMRLQESDVDDLAADVFAAAWKSLERFRRECRLRTWLTSITRRVVQRQLRRAGRVKLVRRDLDHVAGTEQASGEPIERLLVAENCDRLEAAMDQLPATWRHALVMHYQHRLSYREIGKRLGMSINSVGPLLARGRRRLKELLHAD